MFKNILTHNGRVRLRGYNICEIGGPTIVGNNVFENFEIVNLEYS